MATKKPKEEQTEIPMEGPGVAPIKDKKLDKLCDSFIEHRDESKAHATLKGQDEVAILNRMAELNITTHKFADQIATVKPGKAHVKIRTVDADVEDDGEGEPE